MKGLIANEWKMRDNDRRRRTAHALWVGCFNPRRRNVRRQGEFRLGGIDWHHPHWLAVAMLVLLFCCADIVLTLVLVGAGGREMNPVMRPLVGGSVSTFIYWKFGATAVGVIMLILLARVRLFGTMPVGPILYAVLAGYMLLIAWEAWLLVQALGITSVSMLLPG